MLASWGCWMLCARGSDTVQVRGWGVAAAGAARRVVWDGHRKGRSKPGRW